MSSLHKALLLFLVASAGSAHALESTSALSTLGSALKTDAAALGTRTVEVAKAVQVSAQSCFESTRNSLINMHRTAQNGTISTGQWIEKHPNITMAIAAVAVLGYSVYKIRQIYQTYKRGQQTATINLNVTRR